MQVLIISGSPREESKSAPVAYYLQSYLQLHYPAHNFDLLDLRKVDVGRLQNVWGNHQDVPNDIKEPALSFLSADGFILVSPEHNGSYPAALKNFLDHFPKKERKVFGIVTASIGNFGGMRVSLGLSLLVTALFGILSPYFLMISNVDKQFTSDNQPTSKDMDTKIEHFAKNFIWLLERVH